MIIPLWQLGFMCVSSSSWVIDGNIPYPSTDGDTSVSLTVFIPIEALSVHSVDLPCCFQLTFKTPVWEDQRKVWPWHPRPPPIASWWRIQRIQCLCQRSSLYGTSAFMRRSCGHYVVSAVSSWNMCKTQRKCSRLYPSRQRQLDLILRAISASSTLIPQVSFVGIRNICMRPVNSFNIFEQHF